MKSNVYRLSLALLLSAMVTLWTCAASAAVSGPAPNFTLKSRSGKNIKLSELRGQVVLINFWASWCGPCRQEMPKLNDLYERYHGLGFTILGVNVEQDSRNAQKLLKDIPVNFPVLFDTSNTVSQLYNVSAMPSTVIVDRNGNMRFLHKGYQSGYEAEYQKQVKSLLLE